MICSNKTSQIIYSTSRTYSINHFHFRFLREISISLKILFRKSPFTMSVASENPHSLCQMLPKIVIHYRFWLRKLTSKAYFYIKSLILTQIRSLCSAFLSLLTKFLNKVSILFNLNIILT